MVRDFRHPKPKSLVPPQRVDPITPVPLTEPVAPRDAEPPAMQPGSFHTPTSSGAPIQSPTPAPIQAQIPVQPPIQMSDFRFYEIFMDVQRVLDAAYVNHTSMFSLGGKTFTLNSVLAAGILSKTNVYLIGTRGTGKTLLAEAIRKGIFADQNFMIRGDLNLTVKDLFMMLKRAGKSDGEIEVVAKNLDIAMIAADELNRIPGPLQNQLLSLLDGRIEIRGIVHPLGQDGYMIVIATGNPPSNGDHPGTFEEDVALLDRLPLIINMDEVPLTEADVFEIFTRGIDKGEVPQRPNMTREVVAAYQHLKKGMYEDSTLVTAAGFLPEILYPLFRYTTIADKVVDKTLQTNWRSMLVEQGDAANPQQGSAANPQQGGEHAAGSLISYCSEISTRTLQHAGRLGYAFYLLAKKERELKEEWARACEAAGQEKAVENLGPASDDFALLIEGNLRALALALNYDRHFMPEDLPRQLNLTHKEMLNKVIEEVRTAIPTRDFENACYVLDEFRQHLDDPTVVAAAIQRAAPLAGSSVVWERLYSVMVGLNYAHGLTDFEDYLAASARTKG